MLQKEKKKTFKTQNNTLRLLAHSAIPNWALTHL